MYFNWLIGQGKMKRKYITASISSNYQWILDARAKNPSSYLFFIKHSSTKEAINFPRWKQLRKAQAVVCAEETGALPLANHMLPDASNPPKAFSQLLAQGFFPDVGHPAALAINLPTAPAPWDVQILLPYITASIMGTKHSCFWEGHTMPQTCPCARVQGKEMSVCSHVMLQDTCTQLCAGWTSSHTQRSRWSLVTQSGTTKETPHGEQSWRKARVGPCGERSHLSN